MKSDVNIIDEVLNEHNFTEGEKNNLKELLRIVTENKKFGLHKDLRIELLKIIERDEEHEN